MAQAERVACPGAEQPSLVPFALWRAPEPRTWAKKSLAILLAVPIALWFGYVVVVNVMLSTGLVARLASCNPTDATMHYGSAWSLWPGAVHMKDFRISGSDSVLQWAVELDEGYTEIHLTELLRKKFHASHTDGKGLVFRMRLLVDPTAERDLDALHVKALPPIPEFTNPALKPELPPAKDLEHSDVGYNLWTVQLEGIDTTLKEIWIQQVRYAGEGRVRGAFFFKPMRAVEVKPSTIELRAGEVHIGPDIVARLDADLDAKMDVFDPRNIDGLNIFETLFAHVKLDAELPGLDSRVLQGGAGAGPQFDDGSGQLRADLTVNKGVVGPGSRLSYATSHLEVGTPELRATVEGDIGLRVNTDGSARGVLSVLRAKLDWPGKSSVQPLALERVEATVDLPELQLMSLPLKVASKVDVGAATIPDLTWLNGAGDGPDAVAFTGGAAFMSGQFAVDREGRGTGVLRAQMKRGAAQWQRWKVKADASAELTLDGVEPFAKKVRLRKSHVEINNLETAFGGAAWPSWWARVEVDQAKMGPGLMEAALRLECKDAQPAVALLDAQDAIPGWATGLLLMEGLKASATVKQQRGELDFTLLQAEGGSLAIRGRVKKSSDRKALGAFLVQSGPLSVGIELAQDGVGARLLAGDTWIREKMAALER